MIVVLSGCDTGISGTAFENQPPNTELSVQDESLVDNLEGADRLISTVHVSWVGDDADGFVQGYEIRFYDATEPEPPLDEWSFTESTDSTLLLPIRQGERTSDVVFEVRAVDNEELRDPTPARSVFPVKNSPPTLSLSPFEMPPDTTFNVVSFSLIADDPDGISNLASIDVSLNDTLNFTTLPGDTEFFTLVAPTVDPSEATSEVSARVYLGRGFESTAIEVPGMRLSALNTLSARSVDLTDTTSTRIDFEWYVKPKTSNILYVNDYRRETTPVITSYHLDLLRDHVGASRPIDIWDVTQPFVTGSTGNFSRSESIPATVQPTVRRFLAGYDYIYWVSSNTTDRIVGNNLPFIAPATDLFFQNGGKMMVHSPITTPPDREQIPQNAAIFLMPLTDLIEFPDSLRPSLRLPTGRSVSPASQLPGTMSTLPELVTDAFLTNTLPYIAESANLVPLYEAEYQYLTRSNARGTWTGSRVIASISADRRIAMFTLPMVSDQSGEPILVSPDGDPEASRTAIKLILESLGFPN